MLQKGDLCYASTAPIGSRLGRAPEPMSTMGMRLAMYISIVSSPAITEGHIVYVFSTGTTEYIIDAVAIPKD